MTPTSELIKELEACGADGGNGAEHSVHDAFIKKCDSPYLDPLWHAQRSAPLGAATDPAVRYERFILTDLNDVSPVTSRPLGRSEGASVLAIALLSDGSPAIFCVQSTIDRNGSGAEAETVPSQIAPCLRAGNDYFSQ
ncbi:MAG: hypothetical protein ACO1OD_08530 [Croceibacterium sp.]